MNSEILNAALQSAFQQATSAILSAVSAANASVSSTNAFMASASAVSMSSTRHSTSTSAEGDMIEEIKRLLSLQLSKSKVARALSLSRSMLYKILKQNGLQHVKYSAISDAQLDEVLIGIKRDHPSSGEIMIAGHLRSRGLVVQRSRLRASLHRVDAAGINARRLKTIQRRSYDVPAPNYVWHIDGTHKLIKWKFVTHVAIDGFSRLITFCRCSTNNKSNTVLNLFIKATEKYGFPLRVRTDFGTENVRVWEHVYRTTLNSHSVIVGTSVHNQRVERLHRDINVQVINRFYNEFVELESEGFLDATNDTDLFCLHLVYMPTINRCLDEFVNASNHHSISTEGKRRPIQLFEINLRLLQFQSLDQSGTLDIIDLVSRSNNDVHVIPPRRVFDRRTSHRLSRFVSQNRHIMDDYTLYQRLSALVSRIIESNTNDAM